MPWFTDDHGTLPQWYLDDTQKFFDWLQAHQRERGRVGPKATSSQAKKMLTSGQAYSMGYYNKERITI